MIDQTIQLLASEHAQTFKSTKVVAIQGTPVADLMAYCREDTNGTIITTDDFDATMEGLADTVADAVRNHLDFSRNVAKTALLSLQEQVTDSLKTAADNGFGFNPFAGMDIVEQGAPELLENGEFLSLIDHHNSGLEFEPKVAPRFGPRTDAQIIEMCSTGNSTWDAYIEKWIAELPVNTLQVVWQSVFMDKAINKPTVTVVNVMDLMKDYTQGYFSCLVVFLICSRLQNNIDDEFGHDLTSTRQYLSNMLQTCSVNVERGINWYNSFITTNSLVSSVDAVGRKIKVNKGVFKQFLKDGGKADVIMGLLISGKNYRTVADINANTEELLHVWSLYVVSRENDAQSAMENFLRTSMQTLFRSSLDVTYSEDEQQQLAKPGAKETAINLFQNNLSEYSRAQLLANWTDALWRSACKSRFYYSTVTYDILDAIDTEVVANNTDAQDAATMAVQKVVGQFVGEMLKTEPV